MGCSSSLCLLLLSFSRPMHYMSSHLPASVIAAVLLDRRHDCTNTEAVGPANKETYSRRACRCKRKDGGHTMCTKSQVCHEGSCVDPPKDENWCKNFEGIKVNSKYCYCRNKLCFSSSYTCDWNGALCVRGAWPTMLCREAAMEVAFAFARLSAMWSLVVSFVMYRNMHS